MKRNRFFAVIFFVLFSRAASADGVSVCDFSSNPWQVWRGVSEAEKEYTLEMANTWDTERKVEILNGSGVTLCNLVPEEGMSLVVPNGFDPTKVDNETGPEKRAWVRTKNGGSFPIMSAFVPDVTKVVHREHSMNLVVEEENNITIKAGKKQLLVSPQSLNDVDSPPPTWEPMIQPPKGEMNFRKNVREVVADSDDECGSLCKNTVGAFIVAGIVFLITEIAKESKASHTNTPNQISGGGPANPAGFLTTGGRM